MVYFELLFLFMHHFYFKVKELEISVNLTTGFSDNQILFLIVAFIFYGNAKVGVD
jgi:hypothetical protein